MRAIAAGVSDVGLQREHNEDSFVVLKEYDLFVVADGMGGHRAGDVASKLATETISEFFKSTANDDVTWPFHFDTNLSEEENRLLTGIRVANRQIFERSTRSREYHGMGTTVVGAMFSPRKNRMYIGHVGDSRCYRVREGAIQLLTRDHSLINDYLLAMPDLTEEQRSELPKNVITRALGMQDQVVVDIQHDDPRPGDVYCLCSDGLSGMVQDEEILKIVGGGRVNRHRHSGGQVLGFCLKGSWRYLEREWVARPGTFVYEPPGDIHTLVVDEGEMQTLFLLEGVVQYLDEDDNVVTQDDVFTKLDRYLKFCKVNGVEAQDLCY